MEITFVEVVKVEANGAVHETYPVIAVSVFGGELAEL